VTDDKRATLRVLDDLQMKSLDGKREYVASLRKRDDEQALSLLVECLCDESAFLRKLAEKALIEKGISSTEVLIPHLTQGLWYTRASVARIVGRLGVREALTGLMETAADANREVSDAAVEALAGLAAAGHGVSVARALHTAPRALSERALARAERAGSGISGQLQRLMEDRELMTAGEEELLSEDIVAAEAQDNLEWEVLTGKGTKTKAAQAPAPDVAAGDEEEETS
jgi:HEAT repeat protein